MARLANAKSGDKSTMPKPDDRALASPSKLPFYETNLFWGSVGVLGICVSIVLTVIAAMLHDIRWLLVPAGVIGIVSVACFRKVFGWSYWFVAFGTVVIVASLMDVNMLVNPSLPSSSASGVNPDKSTAIDEAVSLNKFIGGKDEFELQQLFAFDSMVDVNIRMASDKVQLDMARREAEFSIEPYRSGTREVMLDTLIANPARQGGGLRYNTKPFEIAAIILPEQYSDNKKKLESYIHSGTMPTSIRDPLQRFDSALDNNAQSLIRILNDASHNHPDYLSQHNNVGSPNWKVIEGLYREQFVPLQPLVEVDLKAIRQFLGL